MGWISFFCVLDGGERMWEEIQFFLEVWAVSDVLCMILRAMSLS